MASQSKINGTVRDIGGSSLSADLKQRLLNVLMSKEKGSQLPDEFLYQGEGLILWNTIILKKWFYQTTDETALFEKNGQDIATQIKISGVKDIVDIGSGDSGKPECLLAWLEKLQVKVTYLALDISKTSLDYNVSDLAAKHSGPGSNVTCVGLWGTFQDGHQYFSANITGPRLFLSLGSVLCNDEWDTAIEHLKSWTEVMRPGDWMLVGMDGHTAKDENQKTKMWNSYHPGNDMYQQFFANGYRQMNRFLDQDIFNDENWEFKAAMEEEPTTRHRNWVVAKKDIECKSTGGTIKAGQEFDWFDSHKYGEEEVRDMCSVAGLEVVKVWKAKDSEFRQYLIQLKCTPVLEDTDSGVSGLA